METTVTIHQIVVALVVGQLKIVTTALSCPTQTYRVSMLIARLSHWTVVKGKLLSISYVFYRIHPDHIFPIWDCWYCTTIWIAGVRKSAGEVALLNWIHYQHIISQRFIFMLLQINVVELWNNLLKFLFLQNFLYEVLPLIPPPRLINLPKIFNDESASFNTLFSNAFCSFSLCMNSKKLVCRKMEVSVCFVT